MRTWRTYAAFARIGATHAAHERAELYGRIAFVAIVLGVFQSLWRAIAEAGMPVAVRPDLLVWYLAATEWIIMSPPSVHVDIEGDVRRGEVAYQLTRPYSYPVALFAQGAGALAVRAPIFAAASFGCAWAFTGRLPAAHGFIYLVPFGIAAMLLIETLFIITGLTAFWLGDVSPIFWLWQKLLFTLGGLMLPLTLYPLWLQRVADLTPFPSLLARPAGFLLGGGRSDAWSLAWRVAIWAALSTIATTAIFRRAIRALQINGG